ncbi:transglycosylase SLT domain-containing protein [Limibacter armeniacum]|uniref:lytic transglycosylase domain-containing protein n=1 Tax=Limibacter armeniacum TaxID=466084 RepID=UPI002FE5562F
MRLKIWLLSMLCQLMAFGLMAQNIPDELYVLNTKVRITQGGKAEIAKKVNSLTSYSIGFQEYVHRCDIYFPQITKVFRREGVPEEFKFLALQESTLKPDVVSKSNAVGYWQFKIETARERGLRVDGNPEEAGVEIDERMNIISSSEAAAAYLKKSYKYLNSWVYALLSYNTGLTGCKNWIEQNRLDPYNITVDENTHFYILHFLANYIAFKDQVELNAPAISLVPFNTNGRTLQSISTAVAVDETKMSEYNQWLRVDGYIPSDKVYTVLLPAANFEEATDLMAAVTPISSSRSRGRKNYVYDEAFLNEYPFIFKDPILSETTDVKKLRRVNGLRAIVAKEGDDMKSLAKSAGISRWKFRKLNDLSRKYKVESGTFFYLEERPDQIMLGSYYLTQSGDKLPEIAKRFGIELKSLRKLNGIGKNEEIGMGRKIFFSK